MEEIDIGEVLERAWDIEDAVRILVDEYDIDEDDAWELVGEYLEFESRVMKLRRSGKSKQSRIVEYLG